MEMERFGLPSYQKPIDGSTAELHPLTFSWIWVRIELTTFCLQKRISTTEIPTQQINIRISFMYLQYYQYEILKSLSL